jgi:hypothetical protein
MAHPRDVPISQLSPSPPDAAPAPRPFKCRLFSYATLGNGG